MLKKSIWTRLLLLPLLLTACQSQLPTSTTAFRTLQATATAPPEALFQEPAAAPFVQRTRQGLLLAYQGLEASRRQIFVRRSHDGKNWASPVQVSQNSLSVTHPQIIEDAQGKLKLFYHSNESEAWQLYLSESKDAQTWTPPQRVALPEAQISDSALLYTQKEYLLSYQAFGGGIFLTRSGDGHQWSAPVQISASGEAPSLVRDAQGRYVLAYEGPTESGWTIYSCSSRDLKTWSKPQVLGTAQRSRWGRLVSGGQGVVLVFSAQAENGAWELYKRRSTDLLNWSEPEQLTHNGLRNVNLQLSPASASTAYLAWEMAQPDSPVSYLNIQQLKF